MTPHSCWFCSANSVSPLLHLRGLTKEDKPFCDHRVRSSNEEYVKNRLTYCSKCHPTSQDSLLISPFWKHRWISGSAGWPLQVWNVGFLEILAVYKEWGRWFDFWSRQQTFHDHTQHKSGARGKVLRSDSSRDRVPRQCFAPLTPQVWVHCSLMGRWEQKP